MTPRGTWPVMTTSGTRVHVGRRDARDRVRGTRAARDDGHAHVARGARVAVGLVHGALFVARQHVLDLRGVVQRVVNLDGLAAWVAEHEVDAFGLERGDNRLRRPSCVLPCFSRAGCRGRAARPWRPPSRLATSRACPPWAAGWPSQRPQPRRSQWFLACVRHDYIRPLVCGRDELRVLREHAVVMLRRRRLPGGAAAFQLGVVHVQRERAVLRCRPSPGRLPPRARWGRLPQPRGSRAPRPGPSSRPRSGRR